MPTRLAARKALRFIARRLTSAPQRMRDWRNPTYLALATDAPAIVFDSRPLPLAPLLGGAHQIAALAELYLQHRFDLLGSGWVQVRHGITCAGMEGGYYPAGGGVTPAGRDQWLREHLNPANVPESERIWRLLTPGYVPIDWQLDFKSGYRWSERTWYLDVRYGRDHGADIKLPWELARMQHLMQFAWAYALASNHTNGFYPPARYAREFRDQVLDFIATNPPRFGVNWACTMEVAIRAANWVTAYGLLRAAGASFDPEFERLLARSLHEHGRHIVGNLESEPDRRTNHYLSDLAGLAFVAAALEGCAASDSWLELAARELIAEVAHQFNTDGSNFEASTSYHRLSAEIVVCSTALLLGLSKRRKQAPNRSGAGAPTQGIQPTSAEGARCSRIISFPDWYFARVARMEQFTRDLTKPNGQIAQVGDNDNGRFLKAAPAYCLVTGAWRENQLDHRHLGAAIRALFAQCSTARDITALDGLLVTLLVRGAHPVCAGARPNQITARKVGGAADWSRLSCEAQAAGHRQQQRLVFAGADLRAGLTLAGYPQFGIYTFRSRRLFLAVRCGAIGQDGHGGHAHNDQLAIELTIDGVDLIADPGTYVYTAAPGLRNRYRSADMHFVPRIAGKEPAALNQGLFRLGRDPRAQCLFFGAAGFVGRHFGYGFALYRMIAIEAQAIRIVDYATDRRGRDLVTQTPAQYRASVAMLGFSPGYGERQPGHALPGKRRDCSIYATLARGK